MPVSRIFDLACELHRSCPASSATCVPSRRPKPRKRRAVGSPFWSSGRKGGLGGEQGSAKTVLSKLLKALIDPNAAPVRALSRDERELVIAADNSYPLAFDNVSGLPHWLSDALCRLATGGSFAVRQLYTDDEEVLFEASRPILLNGIEEVVSRPDLGDRAIFLTLAPIADGERRPEAELWREFEIARPRILGALLDAVVQGLRAINHVQLEALPRVADFALWAAGCETALWPAGTFARAYAANRRAAIETIVEADPLATCVRTIMGERTNWSGSASDLLRLCAESDREDATMRPPWAKNPRVLAGRLRRAQTFLRMLDIEIGFGREGRSGARMIRMSALGQAKPSSGAAVQGDGQSDGYRFNGRG